MLCGKAPSSCPGFLIHYFLFLFPPLGPKLIALGGKKWGDSKVRSGLDVPFQASQGASALVQAWLDVGSAPIQAGLLFSVVSLLNTAGRLAGSDVCSVPMLSLKSLLQPCSSLLLLILASRLR